MIAEGRSELRFSALTPEMAELPEVCTIEGVCSLDRQRARVVGVYRTVDARMARIGATVHRGHAIIVLADEHTLSLLPVWDDDARRPLDEAGTLHGRKVQVVGTVWSSAPEDPSGGASPTGPCVDDIEALELA